MMKIFTFFIMMPIIFGPFLMGLNLTYAQSIPDLPPDCNGIINHPLLQDTPKRLNTPYNKPISDRYNLFNYNVDKLYFPVIENDEVDKRYNRDNKNSVINIIDCLDSLQETETEFSGGIINALENYYAIRYQSSNIFDQLINLYQTSQKLTPDRIVGVETGFAMGNQIGRLIQRYYELEGPCENTTIQLSAANYISNDDNDPESSNKSNKEKFIKIVNCISNTKISETEENPVSQISELFPEADTEGTAGIILPKLYQLTQNNNDPKAGFIMMFFLGIHSGVRGLIYGDSEGSFDPNDKSSCTGLEYTNKELFLDTYSTSDNAKKDSLTTNRILNCLDKINESPIRGFTNINQPEQPVDITSDSYSDVQFLTKSYQEYNLQQNTLVEIPDVVVKGSLDIATAFEMGVQMGQIQRPKEGANNDCQNEYIYFESAHSISNNNKGIHNESIFRLEDPKNKSKLIQLLRCLKKSNLTNLDSTKISSTPVTAVQNSYSDYVFTFANEFRLGIYAMYEFGKIFGISGGNSTGIIDYQSLKKTNYCDEEDTNILLQKMRLYEGINLIPRNPGVLDWRDVKEDGYTDCLTGAELTASLIGRILRFFEVFVGVIAVLMFIYGGVLYITASGDDSTAEKGLKSIYIGVAGIFIILLSRFISEILVPVSDSGIGIDRSKAFTTDIIANAQIASIINWFLGFAAFITVSMIIYGGYLWLVSGGDDGVEEKAKKILTNALIGFVVIFSAYTITMVVLGGAKIENEVPTTEIQNLNSQ